MPYGGSVTISFGLRSPRSRATSSALVELAAQHAMLAAEPQVAEARRRILRKGRSGVGLLLFGNRQQAVDLPLDRSR